MREESELLNKCVISGSNFPRTRDPLQYILEWHKLPRQSMNCFDIRCKINCCPEALAVIHVSQITLAICYLSRRLRETMRRGDATLLHTPRPDITIIVGE